MLPEFYTLFNFNLIIVYIIYSILIGFNIN